MLQNQWQSNVDSNTAQLQIKACYTLGGNLTCGICFINHKVVMLSHVDSWLRWQVALRDKSRLCWIAVKGCQGWYHETTVERFVSGLHPSERTIDGTPLTSTSWVGSEVAQIFQLRFAFEVLTLGRSLYSPFGCLGAGFEIREGR